MKPRSFSKFSFCCLKKPKNNESRQERKTDMKNKKNRDASSYDAIDGYPQGVTLRVRTNYELPPVPKTSQTPQVIKDDNWGGLLHKPKSCLAQPMTIHSSKETGGWVQPSTGCGDEGRPYSCGLSGSETDPVYATVGGGAGGGGLNPNGELSSQLSTGRHRPNSEPEGVDELAGGTICGVDSHHHNGSCGLVRDYALCAGQCDSETGEDSYSGSVVPYYSTIDHVDNNVVHEQDEPTVPVSNQEVYAMVGSSKSVLPDLSIAGPPVPMRSYNSRDVERLLNKRRPRSMGDELRNNNSRPLIGPSLSLATEAFRRRLHLSGHRLLHSHRITQISNNAGGVQEPLAIAGNITKTARLHSGASLNRSQDGEPNLSAGDDKCRSATMRESIATLRTRKFAPDALYESVNLYSEVRRDSVNPYESASHIVAPPYRSDQVDSSSLDNIAGLPLELGCDPYTEISDIPPSGYIDELRAVTRPQKTMAFTMPDSNVPDIYARPSSAEVERKFLPSEQQQPNVAPIFLEMQKFRYVDSETDLSRSITTSSLDHDLCTGSSRSLDEIAPLNPPITPPTTSTVRSSTGVQNSPGSFEPIVHQKTLSCGTANTLKTNSQFSAVAPVFEGSKMTPLMERSMEDSTTTASQVHSNHSSAEPSVLSGAGEQPSGASSLCSVSENAHFNVDDPEAIEDGELFDKILLWPSNENWNSAFDHRNPLAR